MKSWKIGLSNVPGLGNVRVKRKNKNGRWKLEGRTFQRPWTWERPG